MYVCVEDIGGCAIQFITILEMIHSMTQENLGVNVAICIPKELKTKD